MTQSPSLSVDRPSLQLNCPIHAVSIIIKTSNFIVPVSTTMEETVFRNVYLRANSQSFTFTDVSHVVMNSLGSLHLTLSTEIRRRAGNYAFGRVHYPHSLTRSQRPMLIVLANPHSFMSAALYIFYI